MRYAVIVKGISLHDAEVKCRTAGGQGISVKPLMGQIFCDLEPEQATRLALAPGIAVKQMRKTTTGQVAQLIRLPETNGLAIPGLSLYDIFAPLRAAYIPELDGAGATIAVLDSGIRETHEALAGRVILSKNFSGAATTTDNFNHGTNVAFVIAGGKGEKSGVATGARLINIKVLDDNGEGTEEMVVDGIQEVCSLVEQAQRDGLHMTDPMYPNTVNISAGAPDDGDTSNPMRVACRAAIREYGLEVIAAAGNDGPNLSTMLNPAADLDVIAVGGVMSWEFAMWERSSRGPTLDGLIKPDLVCWAEDIGMASNVSDDAYIAKSGTSFSAPILTGVDSILWDLSRRVHGPDVRVKYSDWLQYAYAYCLKPVDATLDKDNSYGYGMPAISVMVQRLLGREAGGLGGLESIIPLVMIIGLMGPLMGAF